jgi:hypothetical protein
VHIRPILCFADCEPIQGASRAWAITGLLMVTVGAIAIWFSLRHVLNIDDSVSITNHLQERGSGANPSLKPSTNSKSPVRRHSAGLQFLQRRPGASLAVTA